MKDSISEERQRELLKRAEEILRAKEKIFQNNGEFGQYEGDVQRAIEQAARFKKLMS